MLNSQTLQQHWQHYSQQAIRSQAAIARILTLILGACIAWQLATLVWSFFTPKAELQPWSAKTVSGLEVSASQDTDIQDLLSANLFGEFKASQKQAVTPVKVQNAPPTRLNLTLAGVVASSDAEFSLAVISNKNSQNTYGIGEKIDGTNASLVNVMSDRVIINNQGKDETLMLDGRDYAKLSQPKAAPAPEPEEDAAALDDDKLTKIREEIMEDPQAVFQYIRLSRVEEDEALKGYRVRPGKSRELFDSVGLQDGDIATVLNGKDLTDPSAMTSLLADAMTTTTWSLTVERDGQLHEIYIDF